MSATGSTRRLNAGQRRTATYGLLFTAVMMSLVGLFQLFQGISAVAGDDLVTGTPNYVFRWNTTTWGWIHIILGAIVTLTGFALFRAPGWARGVAIGLIVLQAIVVFMFLFIAPLWSVIILAIDVLIIWSVANAPDRRGY
jgi:hypothetical protein